ncbi:MAG TPA: hypothetical protein VK735_28730 [Pseudonocardia sp.]|jgi:hypothetical protein|uniref:hypothetical protein n=1 Tax=Pseudonocardia sp. TaxID=60912 RepID=UPI002BC8131E|nr:hypothetical protein [Pseudonocardia sp.]HTF51449.1 hypothetical protein [Pseudonocardia sp.]
MSAVNSVIAAVRRIPRGFSADGHSLGLGLAAALDAQRARGAEPAVIGRSTKTVDAAERHARVGR